MGKEQTDIENNKKGNIEHSVHSHQEHGHGHGHGHHQELSGKKLIWATLMNVIITVTEIIGGIFSNSLADIFHPVLSVL